MASLTRKLFHRFSLLSLLVLGFASHNPVFAQNILIGGRVTTTLADGLAGVTLTVQGTAYSTSTDANGYYSASVPRGLSGTVVPSKTGWTFTPTSRTYTNVTTNQVNQNYVASRKFTISGVVSEHVFGTVYRFVPFVLMNGFPTVVMTDVDGKYTAAVDLGWFGTVTPSARCYTFVPSSRTFFPVTADMTQSYEAVASTATYTISGTIRDSTSTPLPGVTLSGLPGPPVTNASGVYTATVGCGWGGTVTPALTGYTFQPTSRQYTTVTANQTSQNYTGTKVPYTISGTIRTPSAQAIAGVTLYGLPGSPVTDASGNYTATVEYGWSGAATPLKSSCTFSPPSRPYANVTSNQAGQDYTGTCTPIPISGTIRTASAKAIAGVTLNGLPGSPVTDASGNYTATVEYAWSGTATPSKAGCTFSPTSRPYSNVTSNQTGQDYTGTCTPIPISGTVRTASAQAIAGVTLNGLPGPPVTDASGNYTTAVEYGWSGTATPSKANYSFSPSSISYPSVTSNQANQNYTGQQLTYIILGGVGTDSGQPISGVALSGLPGTPVTDSTGNYRATVDYGWSGTATPSKTGCTFSPASRAYSSVSADQSNQNFTGTCGTPHTILGTIGTDSGQPISGVALSGLPGTPVTDSNGNYTATVEYDWSGTVTPSKAGYVFIPPTIAYSNVTGNQVNQNYTGTPVVAVLTTVSGASFFGEALLAPASIAVGFGQALSAATEVAPADPPLPTSLAGRTVKVKDSAGTERLSQLWFVSPQQINFYIPDDTKTGSATVTVMNQSQIVAVGTVKIEVVVPGIFTANTDGQGVPAAWAVRVKGDASQSWEYVFSCSKLGCVPAPIDLGPETEQVFLLLYGTGIRGRSSLTAVNVKIGGVDHPVAYAGPAAGFLGLDQVNIRLSRSLIGRGEVNVVLAVDGKAANTVKINIK